LEYEYIHENVSTIRESIKEAALRVGRRPEDVRIVAVTKTVDKGVLPALLSAGVSDAAENRWQVAREKFDHPTAGDMTWHFIGSLQTNKVKYIVPRFHWIHSVDRQELALALSQEATKLNRNLSVLLQVNVANEPLKHGFHIDDTLRMAKLISTYPGMTLRGLMTMAPVVENSEDVRSVFRQLRTLQKEIRDKLSLESFAECSMGMSDDFQVAIEEGATIVRIGRKLVGVSNVAEGGQSS
jgi:PLP dependent protein